MANDDVDFVPRPFSGVAGEAGWVAIREILQAATMTVRTTASFGERHVTVCSALPSLWPAWHRADGSILLGLQTSFSSSDRSRDAASAILSALATEPDTVIDAIDIQAQGPRLQDILGPETSEVTLHPDFSYLLSDPPGASGELVAEVVEELNERVIPAAAVPGTPGAYWERNGNREYLRWVREEDEDELFDALARLHARRELAPIPGAKYAGAFRSCGLVIPVWDLPRGTEAAELTEPLAALAPKLAEALGGAELTAAERQARSGLVSRAVTLR